MSPVSAKEIREDGELRTLIADILARIRTEEDPDALNAYRSVIRRNVPWFMRSYFASYLLMKIDRAVPSKTNDRGRKERDRRESGRKHEESPRRSNESERKAPRPRSENRNGEGERERRERSIPEAEAATLFVSAGRNRRAYARELLALIESECSIAKEDIGELRVLDNFSFVQVRRSVADDVISGLDGKDFRGRPLAVSYAKPRKEDFPRETVSLPEEGAGEGGSVEEADGFAAEPSEIDE
jgi:hypothetical protein